MITATVNMDRFNAGIRGLIQQARISGKIVIAKETGELIKTLVKVSPPRDLARSKFHAETDVRRKFILAAGGGGRTYEQTVGGLGGSGSGIEWYFVDSHYLRGVTPEMDMRKASAEAVYKVFRTVSKRGRIIVPFKHPRKRQRVMIATKLLVTKAQENKVVAMIKSKFGRLKAAWLVAVYHGPIKISGANMPPEYVNKHVRGVLGAKGTFNDGLATPDNPNFTITNSAKGIGQRQVNGLVQIAVNIRARAMVANAKLFMAGKKNIGDYARA